MSISEKEYNDLLKQYNDALDTLHAICVKGLGWPDPYTYEGDEIPPQWNKGKKVSDVVLEMRLELEELKKKCQTQ